MAIPDISKLSREDLLELQKATTAALDADAQQRKQSALDAAHQAARAQGFDLHDLLPTPGQKPPRKPRAPSTVQYTNPSDPTQTWNGRGRPPTWFRDALAQGASRESLQQS